MNQPPAGLGSEQTQSRPLSVELPTNLRNWFCDATLVAWTVDEINNLNWDHPEVRQYLEAHLEHDPAGLLAVLAFAYVSQVFGSDEIAHACRSDPVFHGLCNGRPPFPRELWSFRRRNRAVLERILVSVFTQAVMRKFGLASVVLPIELEQDLREHAAERLDLARHMDTMNFAQ